MTGQLSKAEAVALRELHMAEEALKAGRWDQVRDSAVRLAALALSRLKK
jgi:hypothetical protein